MWCYSRAVTKSFYVIVLVISLCMIIVSLITNHWLYFKNIIKQGGMNISVLYKFGLFRWCYEEDSVFIECFTDVTKGPFRYFDANGVRGWIIASATFQFLSFLTGFLIILKSSTFYTLIFSSIFLVTALVTCLTGLGLLVSDVDDVPHVSYSYEWSFVLCAISAGLVFMLVPIPLIIYIQSLRKTGDTKFLKKKFSTLDRTTRDFGFSKSLDDVDFVKRKEVRQNEFAIEMNQSKPMEPSTSSNNNVNEGFIMSDSVEADRPKDADDEIKPDKNLNNFKENTGRNHDKGDEDDTIETDFSIAIKTGKDTGNDEAKFHQNVRKPLKPQVSVGSTHCYIIAPNFEDETPIKITKE